jgi:hypothetical protein
MSSQQPESKQSIGSGSNENLGAKASQPVQSQKSSVQFRVTNAGG